MRTTSITKRLTLMSLPVLVLGAASAAHLGCVAAGAHVDGDGTSAESELGLAKPTSPRAKLAMLEVGRRDDVRFLPLPLKRRIVELAGRPHSHRPTEALAEADKPSQLFQYYLLDAVNFEPNPFSSPIKGINETTKPTAAGANGGLPSIGAVRVVVEPKPGLPTDPNDPGAFIDMFTDISGLFVINNESGWYEGWMIHDVVVPAVGEAPSGKAQFGKITHQDALALKKLGTGHDVPGNVFTTDGHAVRLPSAGDRFPTSQGNTLPLPVSTGAFNAHQQSDVHAYWEFNEYTDWVFPLYEIGFTGGIPGTYEAGKVGGFSSVFGGSGPAGVKGSPLALGDNPLNPRDPDRAEVLVDHTPGTQKETRNRFIPSGLAHEVLLDAFLRLDSFEPTVAMPQRLFDAYAFEIAKVDANGDGVTAFEEVDLEDESDGQKNTRLYLPATAFNRFAVTREINDGLLAPRFAPSQRAYVLSGVVSAVMPAVPASQGRDADKR